MGSLHLHFLMNLASHGKLCEIMLSRSVREPYLPTLDKTCKQNDPQAEVCRLQIATQRRRDPIRRTGGCSACWSYLLLQSYRYSPCFLYDHETRRRSCSLTCDMDYSKCSRRIQRFAPRVLTCHSEQPSQRETSVSQAVSAEDTGVGDHMRDIHRRRGTEGGCRLLIVLLRSGWHDAPCRCNSGAPGRFLQPQHLFPVALWLVAAGDVTPRRNS